jgi:hypothetical protein
MTRRAVTIGRCGTTGSPQAEKSDCLAAHDQGQSILTVTLFEQMLVKNGVDETSVEGAKDILYGIRTFVDLHHEWGTGAVVAFTATSYRLCCRKLHGRVGTRDKDPMNCARFSLDPATSAC